MYLSKIIKGFVPVRCRYVSYGPIPVVLVKEMDNMGFAEKEKEFYTDLMEIRDLKETSHKHFMPLFMGHKMFLDCKEKIRIYDDEKRRNK